MTKPDGITIKDILFKVGATVFLGILVLMLIIMLLKPDVEQAGMDMLTGKGGISAGEIGGKDVPMDFFNSARRQCYMYFGGQGSNGQLADCAFMILKRFYTINRIAKEVGYTYTEESLRSSLWEEAQKASKNSIHGAGYSEDDMKKPEQVYRQLLQEASIRFRVEATIQQNIQQNFLLSDLRRTDGELEIQSEASGAKVDLDAVIYTDEDLSKLAELNLEPTDAQLMELYQKESLDPNTPKGKDGKAIPFEERKVVLRGKYKVEARKNALESAKAKLVSLQNEPDGIRKIAGLLGKNTVSVRNRSLSELKQLNDGKNNYSLFADKRFFQDIILPDSIQKKNLGPYRDMDKYAIVSFSGLKFGATDPSYLRVRDAAAIVGGILMEIPQSLEEETTVERKESRSASEE
ncbi:hypothetical protein ACE5IS_03600 [Leptospira wolffii]|uniref:Uncharacterized protein n=1 Tax=Leptospira wolffii TaxID=409998 RepID=A0A2M9ZDB2_9LEPT|nr:hypothetical protein [Leptospira wolffii]EPG67990.1 hypothetical protein LEP1GSC061_0490 [Leptospira wolffii serovar Khorat str. Khorat-H2]PJZ66415.1 hypothetical protein CH371_09135 [Leptospira wolffii]TGK60019.1 hypothetical protein EHQ32_08900 [Leptospira wolffii]TGK72363.1 hypothetical protein EHQ27_07825 [Leptospira wolffii]TGK76026.1 hypothetical protein EHQ35_01650 [Leptospira wolffii]